MGRTRVVVTGLGTTSPVGGDVTTQDIALFLTDGAGNAITSSDGGSNREMVVASNLPGGTYKIIACAFAVASAQAFNAQAFFNVVGGGDVVPAPEDGARNIFYSDFTAAAGAIRFGNKSIAACRHIIILFIELLL